MEDEDLQELAANSDKLIATLVECLDDRPKEDEDLVQERHFEMFDTLCEVWQLRMYVPNLLHLYT